MTIVSRVACIDDMPDNLEIYNLILSEFFLVDTFENQQDFFSSNNISKYSAVLVDFHLKDGDGHNLVSKLKQHSLYNGCPLIFITGSVDEVIRLECLKLGAHDFIHRTTRSDEILLRVKNKAHLFERSLGVSKLGNLHFNLQDLKVYVDKDYVDTTLTELKILKLLIKNEGTLTLRSEIYGQVWPAQTIMPTTLNTHLSNLRNKFSKWDYEIVAEKATGYLLKKR